ncbi:conjugal transfer protein TraH [Psychromonas sp. KJ10-2]|uniref:conjugal transfer protein TraH n=1 Tax=Psychromonas sp. KJ10-2 TaxID=3391822 RepID=UPI0039B36FB9
MMKSNLLIALAFVVISNTSAASSFNDEMERTFGSMTNTTTAKAYNTARRGVVSGGQLFIRNDSKRVNIVSAQAPSFSAGCGGISLFGGSMSMLSKDEFIQAFQAIGSNALGYGVKLALANYCQTCENVMTSLEKTAQALNKMNMDSCQAAQGIVNAGVDFAKTSQAETKAATTNSEKGFLSDFSEAWTWTETSGETNASKLKESDPDAYAQLVTGNATWRALMSNGVKSTYSGDDSLLEVFQSMVGTVIINEVENTDSTNSDTPPTMILRAGHKIKLKELILGGTMTVYECDTYTEDGCLNLSEIPSKEITNVTGVKERVLEALTGTDGLISALQSDEDWSDEAKEFLGLAGLMGNRCLANLRLAVAVGQIGTAEYISEICATPMAIELSYTAVKSYIEQVYAAIISSRSDNKTEAVNMLKESKEAYAQEYIELSSQAKIYEELDSVSKTLQSIRTTEDK